MDQITLYVNLFNEFSHRLNRKLTNREHELITWVAQQKLIRDDYLQESQHSPVRQDRSLVWVRFKRSERGWNEHQQQKKKEKGQNVIFLHSPNEMEN